MKHYYNFSLNILVIFILVCCLFSKSFASSSLLSPDIAQILKANKIVIALTEFDFPPFYEVDKTGKLIGSDIDMAKDIAKELGVKIEFNRSAKSFDGVVDVVASRQANIAVSDLSSTLLRARKALFTEPYIAYHKTLLISRLWYARFEKTLTSKQDPIAKLMQSKVTIGTLENSSYVDYTYKMFPNAKVVQYPTLDDTVQALLKNEIDAYLFDDFGIRTLLLSRPKIGFNFKAIAFTNNNDLIAIAVNWQDKTLFEWLNLYLRIKHSKITYTDDILKEMG